MSRTRIKGGAYRSKRSQKQMTPYTARPRSAMYLATKQAQMSGMLRTGGTYGRFGPGQEWKYHDVHYGALNAGGLIDMTGEIAPGLDITGPQPPALPYHFCGISQGPGANQRIGQQITIRKISLRGHAWFNATISGNTTARIAVILDTQFNGTFPTFTDIFETHATATWMKLANSRRFRILKSWYWSFHRNTVSVPPAPAGTYSQSSKILKWNKSCAIPIEYDGATGAPPEVRSNNLYVAWITEADDECTAHLSVRVRFTDN